MVFVIHLPHQAANSSFVGFQGDPWISVHVDDLRPSSDSTIMPFEAMGATISHLFMGTIPPDDREIPMDQGGAASEEAEGDSDIEMDSEPSRRSVKGVRDSNSMVVVDIEDEGESMDEDEMPLSEGIMSEGSEPEEFEGEKMEEETAVTVKEPHPMNLLPPQCQRLHGCIQAAASRLQDDNRKRATHRVELLVNLIPKDTVQFPLGNACTIRWSILVECDPCLHVCVCFRSDHFSWNSCAAHIQCFKAERQCLGGRPPVGPQ